MFLPPLLAVFKESYVWKMYQERCWEFFPAGDCFRKQYEDQLNWSVLGARDSSLSHCPLLEALYPPSSHPSNLSSCSLWRSKFPVVLDDRLCTLPHFPVQEELLFRPHPKPSSQLFLIQTVNSASSAPTLFGMLLRLCTEKISHCVLYIRFWLFCFILF